MKVKVLRQKSPDGLPYWEIFDASFDGEMSAAALLDHLNYHDDIVTEDGTPTARIGWECACLQGACGACAMVIDGVPALACETFVRDGKNVTVTIEPLKKFPVIRDLIVDRSVIQENLKKTSLYIGEYVPRKERKPKKAEDAHLHQYAAANCLKCGLCLEVCPNYVDGTTFYGALFANDCYLVASRNREREGEIRDCYGTHFGSGCSKALSCMEVCPKEIPTIASMAALNRSRRKK